MIKDLEGITQNELSRYFWSIGDLSWKLDSLQQKITSAIASNEYSDKILILSSRQIGKSFLSACLGVEHCIKYPGSIVRILAPTLKQVSDIVQDNLLPITLGAPRGTIRRSKSDYRWHIGGSTLRLGALERAHVDNNRGGNADFVILEEGGFVPSDDYRYGVESVIGPQLLRSGGKELHISSPSEDAEHYLHNTILPYCESYGVAFRYTVYDSPSVSPKMIDKAIERCGGKHTEAFRREYLAEIVRSPTLMIVPEFGVARHVRDFKLPEYYTSLVSIDFGGIRDKTAAYSLVWDFARAKLLVWDELFLDSNTTTATVVKEAKNIISAVNAKDSVYADCHGQTQVDLIYELNFNVMPPMKQDREAGINNLRLYFQKDGIEIHPRCVNLIGTLKTARYNNNRTDFLRTDAFGHADAIMALMYGARLVDTATNPFPKPELDYDSQLLLPYRSPQDEGLKQFAKDMMPWHPMKAQA